jgi:molybdate transport system permease protein
MCAILGTYLLLIIMILAGDVFYVFFNNHQESSFFSVLNKPEIKNSIVLSLLSCSLTSFLAIFFAVPSGYILSRYKSRFVSILDTILDIPLVLPPLVVGLSLLILFQLWPLNESFFGGESLKSFIVYQVPAVVLAQFTVVTAYAIKMTKVTFMQIPDRAEKVAYTLGCSKFQAFFHVVLPEALSGIMTAWTLAWARSLGEFGPLLIFAGITRNKTEVLSTSVFMELSLGNIQGAVVISLIMILTSVVILLFARLWANKALL